MGISSEALSRAASNAVNQSGVTAVNVAKASLSAQQAITSGTTQLVGVALADNSRVQVSETSLSFTESPVLVTFGPVRAGDLLLTPPTEPTRPDLSTPKPLVLNGIPGQIEDTLKPEPSGYLQTPTLSGDLVVPGTGVRLDNFQIGGVVVTANPSAPVFTAPIVSTSGSGESQPALTDAAQQYVTVVVVGSASGVAEAATGGVLPPSPGDGG